MLSKPPRSLAGKRTAWRQEADAAFGPRAIARLMVAIPGPARPSAAPGQPADPDLLAKRAVATVSARRSTWTAWNIRAEAERVIRCEVPGLDPGRHRTLADAVTAIATSPRHSISVQAPALLDEPAGLRRADGEPVFREHAAGRHTSHAVLDAEQSGPVYRD